MTQLTLKRYLGYLVIFNKKLSFMLRYSYSNVILKTHNEMSKITYFHFQFSASDGK